MRVLWEPLAEGDAGITVTLARMRELKVAATRDPFVVKVARNLVANVSRDPADQAASIYSWVKNHYRFVQGPLHYQLIIPPRPLLEDIRRQDYFQENCASASVLFAALAESISIRSRFHVFSPRAPRRAGDSGFSHVLTELAIGGRWVPYDLTVDAAEPGWRPPVRGAEAAYY